MKEANISVNAGILCSCCDFHSYRLPDVEGMTERQRQVIEAVCQLCLQHQSRSAGEASCGAAEEETSQR